MRGGPSNEYEVSLKTGASVLEHLPEKYHPFDIFIDKKGKWHLHGISCQPEKIIKHLDVVFNALHGEYGEDGKIQKILDHFKIPYTGSNSFSSAMAMNKVTSRSIFEKQNLKIAHGKVLKKSEANYLKLFEVFSSLPKPLFVKPSSGGSSIGVGMADTIENFSEVVREAFKYSENVLVEEGLRGRELTCGVIEKASSHEVLPLPPIEIRPMVGSFFDYKAKYDGSTEEICPAEIPEAIAEEVQNIALKAHLALGLRHYSRTDMIWNEEDGLIYILETNTLPGLTPESLLPKSLKARDISFPEFLDHLIILALHKK